MSDERSFGYLVDLPDHRDYSVSMPKVSDFLKRIKAPQPRKSGTFSLPHSFSDNDKYCLPIMDQGPLGRCTACSARNQAGFFHRKTRGSIFDMSTLFPYKTTRNLMRVKGDTGAYLRTTMKALAVFGALPKGEWKTAVTDFDVEPTPYAYTFAQSFQASDYFRLDSKGVSPSELLDRIKANIVAGLPPIAGFSVYESIDDMTNGDVPFPSANERQLSGHAVFFPRFDDNRVITNPRDGSKTTGALGFDNTWGPGYGEKGRGWLSYKYVLEQLSLDFWSLMNSEWLELSSFN